MVKRKDGSWQEKIRLKDGKYKYFYGKTKAEVVKKIQNYKEDEARGVLFRDIAEEWWDKHEREVSPTTARGYKARYEHALSEYGNRAIETITPTEIDMVIRRLQYDKYSRKVVSTQLNIFNMIFNYAVVNGYVSNNPCSSVKIPKGLPKTRRKLPTAEEIEVVKRSEWLFPYFLLYTGCRRGEALALRYEDIDWENKVIHINKAIAYGSNAPTVKTPKTEAGVRDVILLDRLAERIPKNKTGYIFTNTEGRPYHNSNVQRKWKQWQKANNTTVTAHQLRHGFATILFEVGVDPKDAQALLGHSSVAITQDIYTHIRRERQKETAEKLNAYLK